MTGLELIAAERQRQIDKGFTLEHDAKEHDNGSLTDAASALILEYDGTSEAEEVLDRADPWVIALHHHANEKYRDQQRYRLLVIAGALIAAELDRLDIA